MRFQPYHVLIAVWALSLHDQTGAQLDSPTESMLDSPAPSTPATTTTSPAPSISPASTTHSPRTTTPPPSTTQPSLSDLPSPPPPSPRETVPEPPETRNPSPASPIDEPSVPQPETPTRSPIANSPPAPKPREKPPGDTNDPAHSAKQDEKTKPPEKALTPPAVPPSTPPPPSSPNTAPKKSTDASPQQPARENNDKDQNTASSTNSKSKSKSSLPSWLVPTIIGAVVVAVAIFVLVGIRNNRNKYEDDNHDESTDPTNDNFIAPGTQTLAPKRGGSSVRGSMVPQNSIYNSSAQLPGPPGARGTYHGSQTTAGYQASQAYSKPHYPGTGGQFGGTSPPGGPHYERLSRNSVGGYGRGQSYHQVGYDAAPAQTQYREPAPRQFNTPSAHPNDQTLRAPGQAPPGAYANQNPQNTAAIGVTL
ncbi:unnamed protein product [Albugo candida]|uniref:Mucin-like domain-containing protein n=1 Tax=Albugo candida TaxID=65357 RepID=A0A024G470_9STRA|nr:unnamed protein product [Albugo candida]|eukprot:CCI41109.1 unnamed protein product [Albugo candida]